MSVTLGINPITWTNDDMPEQDDDAGRFLRFEQAFGGARAMVARPSGLA